MPSFWILFHSLIFLTPAGFKTNGLLKAAVRLEIIRRSCAAAPFITGDQLYEAAQPRIESLLRATAWPMETPKPYSFFHLAFCIAGITAAVWLARRLSAHPASASAGTSDARCCRVLFLCGLLLAAGEIYKQAFLYFVIYGGTYNWWYFPFQLCSIPMYLCLLMPVFSCTGHEKFLRTICTFLQDFSLLGGVMALAEPSGLLHPYWTLTVHGLLWHILLIFIGLLLAFSSLPYQKPQDYLRTLPLLAAFCAAATVINVATGGAADMFYISPYYPVTQVVFYELSVRLGTKTGIALYLFALCAGGFLCHAAAGQLGRLKNCHIKNS